VAEREIYKLSLLDCKLQDNIEVTNVKENLALSRYLGVDNRDVYQPARLLHLKTTLPHASPTCPRSLRGYLYTTESFTYPLHPPQHTQPQLQVSLSPIVSN